MGLDALAEFLDREVFEGMRYADVLRRGSRPLVVIGATDMSQGSRIEFLQDPFDPLCSDLGSLKLATAVAKPPLVRTPATSTCTARSATDNVPI